MAKRDVKAHDKATESEIGILSDIPDKSLELRKLSLKERLAFPGGFREGEVQTRSAPEHQTGSGFRPALKLYQQIPS
jgi:hypothetical protein